jgi:phage-related minor tail protein
MFDMNVPMMWKKAMDDQAARVEQAYSEMAKLESKSADQARSFVDEWAKLGRESLGYGLELNAEWRKASLEASKRAISMMSGK